MVDVRDCDHQRFAIVGFGLDGIEGEENGFEDRKGQWLRGVDAREVEAGGWAYRECHCYRDTCVV